MDDIFKSINFEKLLDTNDDSFAYNLTSFPQEENATHFDLGDLINYLSNPYT